MAEVGGIAGERLRSLIERIERLEDDRAAIAGDIREVYAEGKAAGFDAKIMRQVIRLRRWRRPTATNRRRCSTCTGALSAWTRIQPRQCSEPIHLEGPF